MRFSDTELNEFVLEAVDTMGFDTLTPIQEASIPPLLEGRDLIGVAQTGTGKTAAFLLPVLNELSYGDYPQERINCLIMAPTRELAKQIDEQLQGFSYFVPVSSSAVYGGNDGPEFARQRQGLKMGADIIVATPGRLISHISMGYVDLSEVSFFILDEADRMLDMGFLPAVRSIVAKVPQARQTLLFSATIDESIQKNLADLLTDPEIVQIAQKGETAKIVEQSILPVSNNQKLELLKCLLDEKGHDRVIVFARTRHRAEDVARDLKRAGFHAVCIHSDKTQGQRKQALQSFRTGDAGVIVATDVLARGIDIPEVDYVVNYDLPDMPEDYIHRIGRTGRAGNAGFAVSFVAQKQLDRLVAIEALIGRSLPVMRIDSFDVDMAQLNKPSRREKAKEREGTSKKGGKSAARAKRYREKKQEKRDYDYTGYGDLRKGAKKRKDIRAGDEPTEDRKPKRSHAGRKPKPQAKGARKGSAKSGSDKRPGRSQRKKRR